MPTAKINWLAAASVLALLFLSQPRVFCQSDNPLQYPPPGRMVDIGGYKLHINCRGKGNPTVILLHGVGDFSFDWALVQPDVARITRVCAYDRAGVAWSDPGPTPRGPLKLAQELHALLQNSGEPGPYVLVGHSWGGLIARVYAAQYPQDVAGMVLVDATHEDEYWEINGPIVVPRLLSDEEWAKIKPKDAVPRGKVPLAQQVRPPFDRLPLDIQELRLWVRSLPRPMKVITGGDVRDIRADLTEVHLLMRKRQRKHPLGNMPLIVITRAAESGGPIPQKYLRYNMHLQLELSRLSRKAKYIVAGTSDHHIQLVQPELVISAVRAVIKATRSRNPIQVVGKEISGLVSYACLFNVEAHQDL